MCTGSPCSRASWPVANTRYPGTKKPTYSMYVLEYLHVYSSQPCQLVSRRSPSVCTGHLDYSRRGGNGGDTETAMYICTYIQEIPRLPGCQAARTGAKSCFTGQLGDKDRPHQANLGKSQGTGIVEQGVLGQTTTRGKRPVPACWHRYVIAAVQVLALAGPWPSRRPGIVIDRRNKSL